MRGQCTTCILPLAAVAAMLVVMMGPSLIGAPPASREQKPEKKAASEEPSQILPVGDGITLEYYVGRKRVNFGGDGSEYIDFDAKGNREDNQGNTGNFSSKQSGWLADGSKWTASGWQVVVERANNGPVVGVNVDTGDVQYRQTGSGGQPAPSRATHSSFGSSPRSPTRSDGVANNSFRRVSGARVTHRGFPRNHGGPNIPRQSFVGDAYGGVQFNTDGSMQVGGIQIDNNGVQVGGPNGINIGADGSLQMGGMQCPQS